MNQTIAALVLPTTGSSDNFTELVPLLCNGTHDPLTARYTTLPDIFDEFCPAAIWIHRVCIPIWYCVGISGNIVAAAVWIQKRMRRSSSGVYLSALAICHCLFLIFHMPYGLQEYWGYNTLNYPGICTMWPALFYTLQYSSPALVLCFTVERYISVCHPFKRDKLCTQSRAQKVTIAVLLLCFCFAAPQAYFYYYVQDNPPHARCTIRPTVYNPSKTGTQPLIMWAYLSEILVFGIVPLTTLTFNALVVREAKKISKKEVGAMNSAKTSHSRATTVTLLSVSFYHITSVLPVTILYVLEGTSFPPGDFCVSFDQVAQDPVWKKYFTYQIVEAIILMLGFSHYAVNFYIYLLTGKLFRQTLALVFMKACCPGKAARAPKAMETDYNPLQVRRSVAATHNGESGAVYTPRPSHADIPSSHCT